MGTRARVARRPRRKGLAFVRRSSISRSGGSRSQRGGLGHAARSGAALSVSSSAAEETDQASRSALVTLLPPLAVDLVNLREPAGKFTVLLVVKNAQGPGPF